jgi:hypothetical protein
VVWHDFAMSAPVSWLLIRPGWKVFSADGREIGEVDEVAGDDTEDIFDGIALATSVMAKPRYVKAEQVVEISQGAVRLSLTPAEVEELAEFLDPATSEEIEGDNRGGAGAEAAADVREIEGKFVRPVQRHEHSMNVWRRLYLALRRGLGR